MRSVSKCKYQKTFNDPNLVLVSRDCEFGIILRDSREDTSTNISESFLFQKVWFLSSILTDASVNCIKYDRNLNFWCAGIGKKISDQITLIFWSAYSNLDFLTNFQFRSEKQIGF